MTKQAYVDIAGDVIAACLPVLEREGITVVGSAKSGLPLFARLIIQGDRLPDACSSEKLHGVDLMIALDEKDGVKTPRLSAINVLPERRITVVTRITQYDRDGNASSGEEQTYERLAGPEDTARLAGC